jgi:putative oxygen-independent coproporphyrinogen III oxidase
MSEPFGVYVHVPFCAERCDYCAFVTYTGVDDLHDRYVAAVLAELELRRVRGRVPAATSIFFGGGTPSRLTPELLGSIIEAVDRAAGCEITVEVNPEDATPSYLEALVARGVTRVSVGIQSTSPLVLKELGRTHRGDSIEALREAVTASGVERWSVDLIVGARHETDDMVRATLASVLDGEGAPSHVSCYLLTPERGTPLGRDHARHPEEATLADRYELVDELLSARGYSWYEISNWARDGATCQHNQLYWRQGDYLGLGAAAHGHVSGRRSWNVAKLEAYLAQVEAGELPLAGEELVEGSSAAFERLALQLRTAEGVPRGSFLDPESLEAFLQPAGERLVLTRRGRLMADELVRRLQVA